MQPESLLDNLTTAVLWVDAELRCRYLNPAAEDLLRISGYSADTREPLARLLPRAGEWLRDLERALAEQQPATWRQRRLPVGPPDTDGGITVDCTASPLSDSNSLLVELVGLDRHLLISRESALLAEQQTRRSLLRGLAHEIRNPLGGLRGAAQLLERELDDAGQREYTRVIMREADRLRQLVDSLLGPTRPLETRPHNIHALLEHVARLVHTESPGLTLRRDYDPSLPEPAVDGDRIIQVLLNLMRNADQATAGRGTLTLRTRALRQYTIGRQRHRLALRADIEDDGPGIPPEQQEQIFFPLVSGRKDGSGLGLAISQDIVMRHGGLLECDSRPGRTVFSIVLPLE